MTNPPQGPDYRLYKSEPELTTVAEVDESNGEEKSEQAAEKEPSSTKGALEHLLITTNQSTKLVSFVKPHFPNNSSFQCPILWE